MESKIGQQKVSKDRRSIIFVFAVTLTVSFIFWLYPEIPKVWQKITRPLVIGNFVFQKKFAPAPVLGEIKNLTAGLQGAYGVYGRQLADGQDFGSNQNEVFPAASLMKLPAMLTLYQEAEAGRLNLDDQPTGSAYSYRQLAQRMGQYSDNNANAALVKALGTTKIQQTINRLGMGKTSFKDYETTPADIGLFFKKLYQDNLVSQAHREEIFGFLTKSIFEDWLPGGIPVGTRVVHKIGKDLGTFSDGGIVLGQKAFILVIMSKFARESEAIKVLPQISKAVWEFENKP